MLEVVTRAPLCLEIFPLALEATEFVEYSTTH